MKIARPVVGKILRHAEGLGVPSPDTVRQRAQEIALIEGRREFTNEDWKRAFHELHGGCHPVGDSDGQDDEMAAAISERDMVASGLGHHVNQIAAEGSVSMGEELVAEGLDEAEHDLMLEACKEQRAREGDGEDQ